MKTRNLTIPWNQISSPLGTASCWISVIKKKEEKKNEERVEKEEVGSGERRKSKEERK